MTDASTMSVPDYERRCRDSFARQSIMQTFGATLTVPEPGLAVVEMPFHTGLLQHTGVLHAGVVATLADSAGGFAALSRLPAGSEVMAVEFKINYLAPGFGDRVWATGRCLKSGRTLCICAVEVHAADGDRIAHVAQMQQTIIRIAAPEA